MALLSERELRVCVRGAILVLDWDRLWGQLEEGGGEKPNMGEQKG